MLYISISMPATVLNYEGERTKPGREFFCRSDSVFPDVFRHLVERNFPGGGLAVGGHGGIVIPALVFQRIHQGFCKIGREQKAGIQRFGCFIFHGTENCSLQSRSL